MVLMTAKALHVYAFTLGSKVFSWSLRKQQNVALLCAEAKYISARSAACEEVWLRRFLSDLQQNLSSTKSKSTIAMMNPTFHAGTKNVEIRHHFIGTSSKKRRLS